MPTVLSERAPNTPVVVTDDTLALATKLAATVRAAVKDLESDAPVLGAAKTATATVAPSPNSLSAAFEQRLVAHKTAELIRVEESRQAAVKKQAEELAAIDRRKIEAETEIKKTAALADVKKAEFEKKQAEVALKAVEDKRKADLAKAQLVTEYERDLPSIKLTPPAYITGKGALDDSKRRMKEFCRVARQNNDRQPGPIPNVSGSEGSWQDLDKDAVRKAQTDAIKYGDILVEKGHLASRTGTGAASVTAGSSRARWTLAALNGRGLGPPPAWGGATDRPRFRAFDSRVGRGVELRRLTILPKSVDSEQHLRTLFRARRANDAYSVVLAWEERRDPFAVVSEWVEGIDVTSHLDRVRSGGLPPIGPRDAIRLVKRSAHGLDWLHSRARVIHADLKPANLTLNRNARRMVLVDFGSAWPMERTMNRQFGDGDDDRYAAPELQSATGVVNERVDQFAVSVHREKFPALS